jgi:photosystem II stability/assembly factor-like uncharacterized protein
MKRNLVLFLMAAAAHAQTVQPELLNELRWRNIGPFRGGRTRAATGVPRQPNVFYVGQVNGGVWKSDDYGRTWTPIFDEQPTQSIGAIAVAASDPNVVYVASGEGLQRPDLSVGNGIYRSSDAGRTWTHLGLRDGQQIPALAIDPHNPNRLFAAVLGHPYGANPERGLFRSTDGGANWEKVLYVDENTGASDVALDPANPDIVYASLWEARQGPWEFGNEYSGAHGGLFKSIDGGKNWRKLTGGLPAGITQVNIAIAPNNPRRLYIAAATGREVQIFRSDDAGENWVRATTDTRPAGRIGGGDLPVVRVDPKNPDVVYSTSTVTWRSTDGGKEWSALRGAPGGDDYQNMWINPDHPEIILLVSDQGAIVSVNRGRTWSSWYNQPTAQLYHVAATNSFPYRVCGGQQESGSVCISSRGNDGEVTMREWHPVGIIEYGYAAPDPLNPDIIYGAGRGQVSRFHTTTGEVEMITPSPLRDGTHRADRTQPIEFSPVDPHLLYYAANVVFKTIDGGKSWQTISPDLTRPHPGVPPNLGSMAAKDPEADKQRGVVYSLAASFRNASTIWAGTDEGLVWVTRDAGKNWKDISPPNLQPWSKVTQLEASHFDDVSAYASVSRFRVDDLHPYVYRTHDSGKSWQLITNGLPDSPIDTVREDPVSKGLLFAGSETSVWVSFDDGDHWQSLQFNLPHTSMRDLCIRDDDLIVATHGRSFWILDDISRLREFGPRVSETGAWLFKPAAARRVRWNTNTDTPLPPDEPLSANPPDGAVIDYYLSSVPSTPVVLEIRDSAGKLVRRYSSNDQPSITDEDLKKQLIPPYWVRMPRILPASPGAHRWVWDLRYSPPDSVRHEYPIAAVPGDTPRLPLGPEVLPGIYNVKLLVNGKSYAMPVQVGMDPRVKTPTADLRRMLEAQQKLASMMSRTSRAIRQATSLRDQTDKIARPANASLAAALDDFRKKVQAELTASRRGAARDTLTQISGDVYSLYGDLDSADSAPTVAQQAAIDKIADAFSGAMVRWATISTKELGGINRQLKEAGLKEIVLQEAKVDDDDSDADVG